LEDQDFKRIPVAQVDVAVPNLAGIAPDGSRRLRAADPRVAAAPLPP
jgi:hypothetical protein